AVNLIGAGLQDDIHLASRRASELRGIAVRQDLHLFNGLRRRDNHTDLPVAAPLRIIQAVEIPRRSLIAAKRELRGPECGACQSLYAWRQEVIVVDVARRNREILDLLV